MRKIVLTAALAALTLASSVSANWITGEPTILAVNAGEAAFHTALTSDQRLDVNLTAGTEGKADLTFTTKASESELALSSLPVLVSEEGATRMRSSPSRRSSMMRTVFASTSSIPEKQAALISFPTRAALSRTPSMQRIWKISMELLLSR